MSDPLSDPFTISVRTLRGELLCTERASTATASLICISPLYCPSAAPQIWFVLVLRLLREKPIALPPPSAAPDSAVLLCIIAFVSASTTSYNSWLIAFVWCPSWSSRASASRLLRPVVTALAMRSSRRWCCWSHYCVASTVTKMMWSRRRRGLRLSKRSGGSTSPLLASVRVASAVAVGAMSVLAKAASKLEGC